MVVFAPDPLVRDVAEEIRVLWNLHPFIGDRGLERVVFAAYKLASPALKHRIEALCFDPRCLRRHPILGEDPCFHAFAVRPWIDEEAVISRLEKEGIADVLGDPTIWNPMHLNHAIMVVNLVSRLCLYNGVDGSVLVEDSTFRHRIWQYALLLRVCTDYGKDFYSAYEAALAELELSQPGITDRVHSNRFSPEIKRKALTTIERRYELLHLLRVVRERRVILLQAAIEDEKIYKEQQPQVATERPARKKPAFAEPYESTIAGPGNLGEAEFHTILYSLPLPLSLGATLVRMMVEGMVDPDHFLQAEVTISDEYSVVTTPTSRYTSISGFDRLQHRPSQDLFSRVVSRECGQAFVAVVKGKDLETLKREATAWLDSIVHGSTLPKLRHALLYHGPLWMDYPSLYAHLGLDGKETSMPGWRYYAHFQLREEWTRIAAYLSRFGGSPDFASILPPDFCCGSECTPTLSTLRAMVKTLSAMLNGPILSLSVDGLISRWNGIAALAHLFVLAFTFLRNYPFQPPELRLPQSDWQLVGNAHLSLQKNLVVTYYPELLRSFLGKVRAKWGDFAEALEAAGVELDYRGSFARAYGFWSLPSRARRMSKLISCYQEPCGWQCCHGLLHCPETEVFAGLHRNAMRHFTVTTLLQGGRFGLGEVNWLHGHGVDVLQPLSSYRLEPGRSELQEEAVSFLCKMLDWELYL